jgi:hypothetical protein
MQYLPFEAAGSSLEVFVPMPSPAVSSNIGLKVKSGRKVLDSMRINKDRFTFCLPPELFGPHLLFSLRSKNSGLLLLVVMQAKKRQNVVNQVLIHGVRSIAPSWFWKSKDFVRVVTTGRRLGFSRYYRWRTRGAAGRLEHEGGEAERRPKAEGEPGGKTGTGTSE